DSEGEKPFLQKPRETVGRARRRRQADIDGRFAFFMQQNQRKSTDAGLARGEQALELHQEPARREEQPLGVIDLRRQLEPGVEARRRLEESARLGLGAERAIELVEEPPAAALREPIARQARELADRVDSYAFQKRQGF